MFVPQDDGAYSATKLIFLLERPLSASSSGANLVCCSASGWVRISLAVGSSMTRELTIRQRFAPRQQTKQWVDWVKNLVFRANFYRYERARTVRTSLAVATRPRAHCRCSVGSPNSRSVWIFLISGSRKMNCVVK